MRRDRVLALVGTALLAVACGGTVETLGDGGLGDGGCLEGTPTEGSACNASEVLCHPGNPCCTGEWICSATSQTWALIESRCACEVIDSGLREDVARADAQGDRGMTADTATDTAASDATSDGTHDATSDGTHDATSDGTHDATPDTSSGTTFACGPVLKCDAATQYCAVENSPIGTKTTYACLMPDGGGAPSCHGMSIKMPGGCGCYQSPTGEVTITSCPP